MAMYKARVTVFKDPAGKTLHGPTFVHGVGDFCSAIGLMGILYVILALMDNYGTGAIVGGIVAAVVGFALMVVLHKKAKKDAAMACLKMLAEQAAQEEKQP